MALKEASAVKASGQRLTSFEAFFFTPHSPFLKGENEKNKKSN